MAHSLRPPFAHGRVSGSGSPHSSNLFRSAVQFAATVLAFAALAIAAAAIAALCLGTYGAVRLPIVGTVVVISLGVAAVAALGLEIIGGAR